MNKIQNISLTILRLGLAFVFLWFGFSQLSDSAMWTSFVPSWTGFIAPAGTLVLINGLFEIFAGMFLAFGVFTRVVAFLLGAHLLLISFGLGLTAIGVRDIGLSLATLALAGLGGGRYTITSRKIQEEKLP